MNSLFQKTSFGWRDTIGRPNDRGAAVVTRGNITTRVTVDDGIDDSIDPLDRRVRLHAIAIGQLQNAEIAVFQTPNKQATTQSGNVDGDAYTCVCVWVCVCVYECVSVHV